MRLFAAIACLAVGLVAGSSSGTFPASVVVDYEVLTDTESGPNPFVNAPGESNVAMFIAELLMSAAGVTETDSSENSLFFLSLRDFNFVDKKNSDMFKEEADYTNPWVANSADRSVISELIVDSNLVEYTISVKNLRIFLELSMNGDLEDWIQSPNLHFSFNASATGAEVNENGVLLVDGSRLNTAIHRGSDGSILRTLVRDGEVPKRLESATVTIVTSQATRDATYLSLAATQVRTLGTMSSILSTWENSNDDTIFDRAPLPRYSSQRMINLEYSPNMEPLLSRRTAFTLNVLSQSELSLETIDAQTLVMFPYLNMIARMLYPNSIIVNAGNNVRQTVPSLMSIARKAQLEDLREDLTYRSMNKFFDWEEYGWNYPWLEYHLMNSGTYDAVNVGLQDFEYGEVPYYNSLLPRCAGCDGSWSVFEGFSFPVISSNLNISAARAGYPMGMAPSIHESAAQFVHGQDPIPVVRNGTGDPLGFGLDGSAYDVRSSDITWCGASFAHARNTVERIRTYLGPLPYVETRVGGERIIILGALSPAAGSPNLLEMFHLEGANSYDELALLADYLNNLVVEIAASRSYGGSQKVVLLADFDSQMRAVELAGNLRGISAIITPRGKDDSTLTAVQKILDADGNIVAIMSATSGHGSIARLELDFDNDGNIIRATGHAHSTQDLFEELFESLPLVTENNYFREFFPSGEVISSYGEFVGLLMGDIYGFDPNQVVAKSDAWLEGRWSHVSFRETNLGNFYTDILLRGSRHYLASSDQRLPPNFTEVDYATAYSGAIVYPIGQIGLDGQLLPPKEGDITVAHLAVLFNSSIPVFSYSSILATQFSLALSVLAQELDTINLDEADSCEREAFMEERLMFSQLNSQYAGLVSLYDTKATCDGDAEPLPFELYWGPRILRMEQAAKKVNAAKYRTDAMLSRRLTSASSSDYEQYWDFTFGADPDGALIMPASRTINNDGFLGTTLSSTISTDFSAINQTVQRLVSDIDFRLDGTGFAGSFDFDVVSTGRSEFSDSDVTTQLTPSSNILLVVAAYDTGVDEYDTSAFWEVVDTSVVEYDYSDTPSVSLELNPSRMYKLMVILDEGVTTTGKVVVKITHTTSGTKGFLEPTSLYRPVHMFLNDLTVTPEDRCQEEYLVGVHYFGQSQIDPSVFDTNDFTIYDNHSVPLTITEVEVRDIVGDFLAAGQAYLVIYHVQAPNGRWDASDDGDYTLQFNEYEINDVNGNYMRRHHSLVFRVRTSGMTYESLPEDIDELIMQAYMYFDPEFSYLSYMTAPAIMALANTDETPAPLRRVLSQWGIPVPHNPLYCWGVQCAQLIPDYGLGECTLLDNIEPEMKKVVSRALGVIRAVPRMFMYRSDAPSRRLQFGSEFGYPFEWEALNGMLLDDPMSSFFSHVIDSTADYFNVGDDEEEPRVYEELDEDVAEYPRRFSAYTRDRYDSHQSTAAGLEFAPCEEDHECVEGLKCLPITSIPFVSDEVQTRCMNPYLMKEEGRKGAKLTLRLAGLTPATYMRIRDYMRVYQFFMSFFLYARPMAVYEGEPLQDGTPTLMLELFLTEANLFTPYEIYRQAMELGVDTGDLAGLWDSIVSGVGGFGNLQNEVDDILDQLEIVYAYLIGSLGDARRLQSSYLELVSMFFQFPGFGDYPAGVLTPFYDSRGIGIALVPNDETLDDIILIGAFDDVDQLYEHAEFFQYYIDLLFTLIPSEIMDELTRLLLNPAPVVNHFIMPEGFEYKFKLVGTPKLESTLFDFFDEGGEFTCRAGYIEEPDRR